MSLDQERDVLKNELEKTTASVGPSPILKDDEKKVGVGIRTYSADIADIMRREKGSVIKIALAEQEKEKLIKKKRSDKYKNLIVILLGVVFIVSGVLIFIYTIINRDAPISV
ncbi:MAG: hypothetical protein R3B55_00785 [Candidatus Paceibacterota bacterium]